MKTITITITITIAGGGLAGLATGIALRRRGIPVELHEAATYPRHRVCGEFISGLSDETIETLGVGAALADCRLHTSTAWFNGNEQIYTGTLPEAARAISRYTLDVRLRERFTESGGFLHERSRLTREPREGLVWAAGRRPDKGSRWLGLKAHFLNTPQPHGLEMHLGRHAYVGITPVEDGRTNVCGLFLNDGNRRAESGAGRLIAAIRHAGMSALADRLDEATPDESSFCGVSALHFGRQTQTPGLCSLGDAESMIPPFTGNGMTMAFQAAELALPFLAAYAEDRASWPDTLTNIEAAQQDRFRRRLRTSHWLHPFLLSAPGQKTATLLARGGLLPFQTLYRALR